MYWESAIISLEVTLLILASIRAQSGPQYDTSSYGDFDDSGESCEENFVSHFLDIRFCGHSNFHFYTNIISLKI